MLAIRAVFLLTGAILGVFYPFVPAILSGRGFSSAAIGLTAAGASLAFALAVPVWGHLADMVTGRVRALQVAIVGSTVAVLALLLQAPTVVVAICVVGYAAFESAMAPIADALAVNALARSPRSYARVRLLASVGFAGTSIAAGALYNRTGLGPAPLLWAGLALVMLVVTRWVPDLARHGRPGPGDGDAGGVPRVRRPRGGSFGMALRAQPRLRGVLLGLGLVHIGILAGFTFLSLRILQLGGQASDVALSAGLSALAEIPAMFLIPRVVARIGIRALLVGGILLYAAVMLSWAFIADPGLIIATRVPSGVAYAAITISAVLTIAALLPPELQATGQGLYQTTGFGIAAVVANLVGGLVFGAGGAMPLFLGCTILALVGAAVAWRTVPPYRAGPSTIAARQEG
jgi:MFS family permease